MVVKKTNIPMPTSLSRILETIDRCYVVGGAVRDHLLGLRPKDIDIEVYGKSYPSLAAHLENFGKVDLVGESFAVIKLTVSSGETFDFALPRTESKAGAGHRSFDVSHSPMISEREAASRRDVTMNALLWSPRTFEILDFFGGQEDIKRGVIRHTSDKFGEDPLRPLRVFQFAARFGFDVHPDTSSICKGMVVRSEHTSLAKERVGEEMMKFLLKGRDHLRGVKALSEMGWLAPVFPELAALDGVEQDPEYHPEGDVLTHTALSVTAAGKIAEREGMDEATRSVLLLAALCHDLGKPMCTARKYSAARGRDRVVSPGHERLGLPPTRSLMERVGVPKSLRPKVEGMVENHMAHLSIAGERDVRALSVRLRDSGGLVIREWEALVEADHSARPPLLDHRPERLDFAVSAARRMGCYDTPLSLPVSGADVLALGVPSGPHVGTVLRAALRARVEGRFEKRGEALAWLEKNFVSAIARSSSAPSKILRGDEISELTGLPPSKALGKLTEEVLKAQIRGEIPDRAAALKFVSESLPPPPPSLSPSPRPSSSRGGK